MAYSNAIPQAADNLSKSQADILANFVSLQTSFDANHVTFDIANTGKHKWVSMPVQAADPAAVVGDIALYTKVSAVTGVQEIFIERPTGTVIEATGAIAALTGWTKLPSGLVLKWGTAACNGLTAINTTTGGVGPAFTHIYHVQLTPETWQTFVLTSIVDPITINVTTGGLTNIRWFAIGV